MKNINFADSRAMVFSLATFASVLSYPHIAAAQSLPSGPPPPTYYPLICQGSLKENSKDMVPFIWSSAGAAAHAPASGHCAWLDRGPRGTEIKHSHHSPTPINNVNFGPGRVVCGGPAPWAAVPAGTYVAFSVYRNPQDNNNLDADIGFAGKVSPPFSLSTRVPRSGCEPFIP